jgi:hypothetical protein
MLILRSCISLDEMLADGGGVAPTLRFAALFTEDESPQLVAEALYFC